LIQCNFTYYLAITVPKIEARKLHRDYRERTREFENLPQWTHASRGQDR